MKSFEDIKKSFFEGIDYQLRIEDRNAQVIVLAPHGGGIEPGTSEIALEIAGQELSYYLFEGIRPKGNDCLHLTSTLFDEPRCLSILYPKPIALAIHGCAGRGETIFVGGRNEQLKSRICDALKSKNIETELSPHPLSGLKKNNICNRCSTHQGLQLEFTTGIRRLMFNNLGSRRGRRIITPFFYQVTSIIRNVLIS